MISLGNAASENKATSEKNLADMHFVVTDTYRQRQHIDSKIIHILFFANLLSEKMESHHFNSHFSNYLLGCVNFHKFIVF